MSINSWFELQLSAQDCRYEVRLNGVPIHTDNKAIPVQARFPVNHWLRSGENTLELVLPDIQDPQPDSASVAIGLKLLREQHNLRTELVVCRLAWRRDLQGTGDPFVGSSEAGVFNSKQEMAPDVDGDTQVGRVRARYKAEGLNLHRLVTLNTGLPDWGWQTAVPISINESDHDQLRQLHQSLWRELSSVHVYLRQRRPEPVANLCEERNRELDLAFGYPAGTTRRRLLASLAAALHDPDLSLAPISAHQLGLDPWPNGQLVRLVRADFSPALVFVSSELEYSQAIDFVFRPDPQGWIICR